MEACWIFAVRAQHEALRVVPRRHHRMPLLLLHHDLLSNVWRLLPWSIKQMKLVALTGACPSIMPARSHSSIPAHVGHLRKGGRYRESCRIHHGARGEAQIIELARWRRNAIAKACRGHALVWRRKHRASAMALLVLQRVVMGSLCG